MKNVFTKFTILIIGLMLINSISQASNNDEATIKKELPRMLGTSNQGTEFFLTFHPCWETEGANDALYIYITSDVATRVTLQIPGKEIYMQKTTLPNDIIQFRLDPGVGQCYRKNDREKPQPQRIFKGYGIIITSEDPIVCYGMTRFRCTSDGYLAIPSSMLGKKYIVSAYNDPCQDNGSQYLTSYTSIVGAFNKTNVKVTLGGRASNYTPGANPMKTGDTRVEELGRGDVWLIGVMGDYNDLTGTTITASKPVSVISGSFCAYVPVQIAACDFLIEQDMPMESWGTKYHVSTIFRRQKASIIRVLASEPNTTVYRDDNEWVKINTAGGREGQGYIERRAVEEGYSLRPITISAKTPITVTQYNTGANDDGIESDPFQLALTPIEQYQTQFLWCCPGVYGGASFKYNYLNLCYKSTEEGQIPEDIEFGKVSNGVLNWRKLYTVVGDPGKEFIDASITDLRKYRSLTIEIGDPEGVYAVRGSEPMAAYGYGFDWYDSYGYAVSACYSDLSKGDVWGPKVSYGLDCKGKMNGLVVDQPQNIDSLRSNLAEFHLVKSLSFNVGDISYDRDNFIPGTTNSAEWNLKVIDSKNDAKATIYFTDRSGNDTTITIEFEGTKVSANNRIENWGIKNPEDPLETRQMSIINDSKHDIVLDSINLLSSDKLRKLGFNGFSLDTNLYKDSIKYTDDRGRLPGYTLAPGDEFKFNVHFDPKSVKLDVASGKWMFMDSILVKVNRDPETNEYCFSNNVAVVKAEITTAGVEDLSGRFGITDIVPNPAGNSGTTLLYNLQYDGDVLISLYNSNGGMVGNLLNIYQLSGSQSIAIPCGELAPGVYILELKSGDLVERKSFVVAK